MWRLHNKNLFDLVASSFRRFCSIHSFCFLFLVSWLLLLLAVQGVQTDVGDLDDLETDSGNITDRMSLSTEPSDQNLVILFDKVEATVPRNESRNLFSVLHELDSDAFSDCGVWLFRLNTDFLKHNSLGVRGTAKRIRLEGRSEVGLFVLLVGPSLLFAVGLQFARRSEIILVVFLFPWNDQINYN